MAFGDLAHGQGAFVFIFGEWWHAFGRFGKFVAEEDFDEPIAAEDGTGA